MLFAIFTLIVRPPLYCELIRSGRYIPTKSPRFVGSLLISATISWFSQFQCVLSWSSQLALFLFLFKWLGCVTHMPLSSTIYCSLFEATTFHPVSWKKKIFPLGRSIIYFVEAPKIDVCHIFFKILDNIILKQLRQGLIFDMLCSLFVVYYWLFHCPEKNKQRGEAG